MNKQEYMHLHGLYREIFDDVDSNREDTECGDLKDAMPDDLPRPVDVSASKDEHRRALFGISGHLGENVEGIKETDFEYDESPRQPDLVSGDIALYRQPGGKRHDTVVVNHDSEESVEIDMAETGKHAQKYQTLCDLAEGYDLDEALQSNYQKPNQRRRKSPYSELDEGDIDKEDLRDILEQSEA
ncbi:hypothetical protein GLU01_00765 [Nanohaloarchaea archaeon]|jgi:hypothetical protein|nr:hypothetical protein [Candidatus Nanohaloarchaea archaeon]